jgi:hypothetical protein
MMLVRKRRRRRSSEGKADKTGGCSGRKTKLVNLPKTLWVMTTGDSINQVTCVTILNIAKIKMKNATIVMASNLSSRHKLHSQIRNKRNIKDMKRVRTKSVLSNNIMRGSIGSMNSEMVIRTQIRKMGRMRSHIERSTKIKIPWTST